jgi:hypothetical protein
MMAGWMLSTPSFARSFTDHFRLQDCSWRATGSNAYWKLITGYQIVLEGEEDGEEVRNEITVLPEFERLTILIDGVERSIRTRVIEERESADGDITEISRNFFARCNQTNDVFYFGEDVDIYEDGEVVSHDGAWRAGVDGAMPGIIMPGTFLKGARYFQEVAPDLAMDRARNVEDGLELETPAGSFTDCVAVLETTPLEPGEESLKMYCPGVGLVVDDFLVITEFGRVGSD